jgi:F-type H+-transporting ATPase subunit b
LVADNERILQEARSEREALLKEAREMRDQIILDAKEQAKDEASRLMENARESINHEKMAAITDIKNQVADLSIDIAESLLRRELGDDAKQKEYIASVIKEIEQN